MTLQELAQIKKRILSERCMGTDRTAPRVTVGMGTCGVKAGANKVMKALQEELHEELGRPQGVMLTHVGCLGFCSYEPVIEVSVPGAQTITYSYMTPEKAREVVKKHLIGGKPVSEWVLATRDQ